MSVLYYSTACCVIKNSKCLILILVGGFLFTFFCLFFYSSRQLEYSGVQVLHFNIDSFVIPPVQGHISFPRAHWSLLKLQLKHKKHKRSVPDAPVNGKEVQKIPSKCRARAISSGHSVSIQEAVGAGEERVDST